MPCATTAPHRHVCVTNLLTLCSEWFSLVVTRYQPISHVVQSVRTTIHRSCVIEAQQRAEMEREQLTAQEQRRSNRGTNKNRSYDSVDAIHCELPTSEILY